MLSLTPVSLHDFSFCAKEKFIFAAFRLATTLVNASVSWSTTSFVNLSALLLIFFVINSDWAWCSGDCICSGMVTRIIFYRAVTAHGVGMVFLFIMPGIISAMGNLHVPTLLGFVDFRNISTEQFGILAFRLVSSVAGRCHGVWDWCFRGMDSLFSSDRNRFPVIPHAVSLAIMSLPLLGRRQKPMRLLFGNIAAGRNSVYLLELRLCRLSNFRVSILLVTTFAYPWSRNRGPLLHFGFSESRTVFGCFWRCRCISTSFLVLRPEVYVIVLPAFGVISVSLEGLRQQPTPSYSGMALCSLEHRRCGLLCLSSHVRSDERLFFVYNSCHWCSYGREDIRLILALSETSFRDWTFILVATFLSCCVFGGFTASSLFAKTLCIHPHQVLATDPIRLQPNRWYQSQRLNRQVKSQRRKPGHKLQDICRTNAMSKQMSRSQPMQRPTCLWANKLKSFAAAGIPPPHSHAC